MRSSRTLPFEFVKVKPQSGRDLSERRSESDAGGEPRGHRRRGASGRARTWAWPGTGLRPLLFFDESGQFIEGYYLVGSWRRAFSSTSPGRASCMTPRLTWNTLDIVRRHGGTPVLCKSGHAFIKQKMREVDAAYGGEMSAHHYFASSPTATAA